MKRLIKGTASFLAVLMLLFIVPLSPARAEEGAERWELEMIRAGFSDQIDLNGQGIRVGVIDSGISPLSCFDALEPGKDYTDADSISAWALEGMEYCVAAGLVQGVSAAELSPQGVLTRAALAVLLARLEG